MPTPETWLWGSGMEVTKRQRGRPPLRFAEVAATVAQVLSDSRFGEYQLGMAVRYSRMVFRDEAVKDEATRAALTTEFEQRIAQGMNSAGVSYFGRLVTRGEGSAEGHQWISATRYGSVDDAHRGTAAVKEMLSPELAKWFVSYESIVGTAVRVLEM